MPLAENFCECDEVPWHSKCDFESLCWNGFHRSPFDCSCPECDRICPVGTVLVTELCMCRQIEICTLECGTYEILDPEACECYENPCKLRSCPNSASLDLQQCRCNCELSCYFGQQLDQNQCKCRWAARSWDFWGGW